MDDSVQTMYLTGRSRFGLILNQVQKPQSVGCAVTMGRQGQILHRFLTVELRCG